MIYNVLQYKVLYLHDRVKHLYLIHANGRLFHQSTKTVVKNLISYILQHAYS